MKKILSNRNELAKDPMVYPVVEAAQLSTAQCLERWNSSVEGLSGQEVHERSKVYGPNEVAQEKVPTAMWQLVLAYKNPFIAILFVLALVSFFVDFWLPYRQGLPTEVLGTVVIMSMIGLSGLLRFVQEFRTNKAVKALKSLVKTTATVQRQVAGTAANKWEIDVADLVPGDLVFLSPGDLIPADLRLLSSRDLFVSQAALSGESLAVEKRDLDFDNPLAAPIEGETGLLALENICLFGTSVASGSATALVVGIGRSTYFGQLAQDIAGQRPETSFDRGVQSVSRLLIRFLIFMVPVVFLINGLIKGDWWEALLFALAVGVGLTPEMLPLIVSANLAKGAVAMSRQKVVVKNLNAIQNLGAMDVLCTDKTGTLTEQEVVLSHFLNLQLQKDDRVFQWAWLNSFHQTGIKNPMDKAVLKYAENLDDLACFDYHSKVDELAFDFERRRLSVVVADAKGSHHLICKGAVDEMLEVTSYVDLGQRIAPLTPALKAAIRATSEGYNSDGYRVLLLGRRMIPKKDAQSAYDWHAERNLILQGFLTFSDPPKASAAPAIQALKAQGIQVKVLTGDAEVIARKVCSEVGLNASKVILGSQLDAWTDAELDWQIVGVDLFARLTPLQKNRVLKAFQAKGHTVGFLGDGINDASALREADVGISVDTAADIAKEAADLILLEKDLRVLENGVLVGRTTFGNIIKYLNMTASSNFGNVFSVVIASAFIPFLPMLAVQLLLQNLLYDLSQLALPWDRMDPEFLEKPKKWKADHIGRFMWWMGPTSSIFDLTTFAVLWFVVGANSEVHQAMFQSGWFVEGLLSQTLVVHLLRTQKIPFFQRSARWPVVLLTVLIMALGVYLPFSSWGSYVGLVPLPAIYFPWLVGTLLCYALLTQGVKQLYLRRFGQWF